MIRTLSLFTRLAVRVPALTLAAILVATLAFGAAASRLVVDTGLDAFAPPGGSADVVDRIEERFGSGSTLQILVDTGPGGDVLDQQVLAGVEQLVATIAADPDVAPVLAEDTTARPAIVSFVDPFATAAEFADGTLATLQPFTFGVIRDEVLDAAGDRLSGLFSDDLDVGAGRARAGLVLISLDAAAPRSEREVATRTIVELVDAADIEEARRGVLSFVLIEDSFEVALARDLAFKVSISLLLVVLVLALLFRSLLDVSVGLIGLVASIVWMIGAAALLGPDVLGVVGPFNQVSIAVPVLLVGLGIDYSVHLTARYREERVRGARAEDAANTAMTTVGVALVLATVASVAGFLANLVSPLQPISDFGVFAAIGIVAAFFVLAGGVVASRTLVDRRRDRRAGRPDVASLRRSMRFRGSDVPPGVGAAGVVRRVEQARTPPAWSRALTRLAVDHSGLTLSATVVLLAAGVFFATGLSTEFDERDFLPDGEPVLRTLDRLEELFVGDVSERTLVLVDGDLDDPELHTAVADFVAATSTVPGVQLTDGEADVTSWLSLRDGIIEEGEGVRSRLASDLEGWADPQGTVADIRLPSPSELDQLGDDLDAALDLPDDLRERLEARLPLGRSAAAALGALADPVEFERDLREQLAKDIADGRPEGLSDAALTRLVALGEQRLTLAALGESGVPSDLVDEADRVRLERLERLEAAGANGTTDGRELLAQLAILREEVPLDLAATVDGSGLLLGVPTDVGQEGARRIAADLEALTGPLVATGAEVAVASELLTVVEIIDELAGSQLYAIAISLGAATLLLVVSSLVTSGSIGLGLIGIVPSIVALVMVLGLMQLLGLPFNALTATVASIAVGIGVPYGIHLINRFREVLARGESPEDAIAETLEQTGPALVGSALTTGLAFAVLLLSSATPIQQFGTVSTLMIIMAVLGCLLVQPSALVRWGRHRARKAASGAVASVDSEPTLPRG
jgi:predicted RND superfamily exporter protein